MYSSFFCLGSWLGMYSAFSVGIDVDFLSVIFFNVVSKLCHFSYFWQVEIIRRYISMTSQSYKNQKSMVSSLYWHDRVKNRSLCSVSYTLNCPLQLLNVCHYLLLMLSEMDYSLDYSTLGFFRWNQDLLSPSAAIKSITRPLSAEWSQRAVTSQ